MSITKCFHTLAYETISSLVLAGMATGCSTQPILPEQQVVEPTNTTTSTSCPTMENRNWHAWIDRIAENEPRLVISGEVDLPTPGYKVKWQPGILDRRQPPTQRLSISFTPSDDIVAQVITPTEINFTMPSPVLEYRSVMIYCGDKLLADIPGVVPTD